MTWPYLSVWIDVWFLQVNTELLHERHECLTVEYVWLSVRVFHRWGFKFRLYSPRKEEGARR